MFVSDQQQLSSISRLHMQHRSFTRLPQRARQKENNRNSLKAWSYQGQACCQHREHICIHLQHPNSHTCLCSNQLQVDAIQPLQRQRTQHWTEPQGPALQPPTRLLSTQRTQLLAHGSLCSCAGYFKQPHSQAVGEPSSSTRSRCHTHRLPQRPCRLFACSPSLP